LRSEGKEANTNPERVKRDKGTDSAFVLHSLCGLDKLVAELLNGEIVSSDLNDRFASHQSGLDGDAVELVHAWTIAHPARM
jgi:hypothetical protein